MAMNCETFKENIDAYTDGELHGGIRQEMEKHAEECAPCREMLNGAMEISRLCAELSEVDVPLAAQAAWRRAVREEAKAKKKPFMAWARGVATAAAAMVVLVAGTYGMRLSESVPAMQDQGVLPANEVGYEETQDLRSMRMEPPGMPAGGYVTTGTGLKSDGSVGTRTSDTSDAAAKQVQTVVLRSAERAIESDSYDSDVQWLSDLVSEYGAYFEERSETAESSDGTTGRVSTAVVRVPSDRLDDFLMELDQLGRTVLRSEAAEDVTGRYMDTESRLETLKAQKEKLNEMLESAADVQELIAIDDKMAEVIAAMESLEGDLRRWESEQSYSRVTLTLTEIVQKKAEAAATLGARMKQGFDESVIWLKGFGQDALVALAAVAPRLVIFIPALVLVIAAVCLIRGKRRR